MTQILTLEELLQATETEVTLPLAALGGERAVRIRKLGQREYLTFLPPFPPEAATWPSDEFEARELAWLGTLSPAALEGRRWAMLEVKYKIVAAAALEPALSLDQARRLGDDAMALAEAVLRFSGLLLPDSDKKSEDALAAPPPADAA